MKSYSGSLALQAASVSLEILTIFTVISPCISLSKVGLKTGDPDVAKHGYIQIKSSQQDLCLQLDKLSQDDGVTVGLAPCRNDDEAMIFYLEAVPSDLNNPPNSTWYQIKTRFSDKCLTPSEGGKDRVAVVQKACMDKNDAGIWRIESSGPENPQIIAILNGQKKFLRRVANLQLDAAIIVSSSWFPSTVDWTIVHVNVGDSRDLNIRSP